MRRLLITLSLSALLSACNGHRTHIPDEKDLYSCNGFTVTSHRLLSSSGKVLFSAESYSYPTSDTIPRLETESPLLDSLFAAALDNIIADSAYLPQHLPHEIYLAGALIAPATAKKNLLSQVDSLGEFRSCDAALPWPASSDRCAMVSAAVETALATPRDTVFARRIEEISRRTLVRDFNVAWSSSQSLLRGAQTYLLPQPSLYPRWMRDVDLFQSPTLGTNIQAIAAVKSLGKLQKWLRRNPDPVTESRAAEIRATLAPAFYQPNLKYYSAYEYSYPYAIQLQATDNMAQSMGVVYGIFSPDSAASLIAQTPVFPDGVPTLFPMPYDWSDNAEEAARPIVQSFWALAANRVRNFSAMQLGMASLLHTAAVSPQKELASPGIVAWVCKGIFGIQPTPSGLSVNPVVPDYLSGRKLLRGFRYQDAEISFRLNGAGDSITSFRIDGKPVTGNLIPSSLKGRHTVEISLVRHKKDNPDGIRIFAVSRMPQTPVVRWVTPRDAMILNSDASLSYQLLINGQFQTMIAGSSYNMYNPRQFTVVNFLPIYQNTWVGFSQPPHYVYPEGSLFNFIPRKISHNAYGIPDTLPAGDYLVRFIYRLGDEAVSASLSVPGTGTSEAIIFLPRSFNTRNEGGVALSSAATVTIGAHRTITLTSHGRHLPDIIRVTCIRLNP